MYSTTSLTATKKPLTSWKLAIASHHFSHAGNKSRGACVISAPHRPSPHRPGPHRPGPQRKGTFVGTKYLTSDSLLSAVSALQWPFNGRRTPVETYFESGSHFSTHSQKQFISFFFFKMHFYSPLPFFSISHTRWDCFYLFSFLKPNQPPSPYSQPPLPPLPPCPPPPLLLLPESRNKSEGIWVNFFLLSLICLYYWVE